jgi:uncharacterized membrane-anchored protein YhcB (DUF1043 family)
LFIYQNRGLKGTEMIWLTGITCLALGIVLGVIFSQRAGANSNRIKELESQIIAIEERHEQYKGDVSEHFDVTSELIQQMTQSYRDVYQHLAMGAQDLCTTEVANKMLPVGSDAVFEAAAPREEAIGFTPPKDYAAKANPEQKGALSEEFGLEKSRPSEQPQVQGGGIQPQPAATEIQETAAEDAATEEKKGGEQP